MLQKKSQSVTSPEVFKHLLRSTWMPQCKRNLKTQRKNKDHWHLIPLQPLLSQGRQSEPSWRGRRWMWVSQTAPPWLLIYFWWQTCTVNSEELNKPRLRELGACTASSQQELNDGGMNFAKEQQQMLPCTHIPSLAGWPNTRPPVPAKAALFSSKCHVRLFNILALV